MSLLLESGYAVLNEGGGALTIEDWTAGAPPAAYFAPDFTVLVQPHSLTYFSAVPRFRKQPLDVIEVEFDFALWLQTKGADVQASSFQIEVDSGLTAVSSALSSAGAVRLVLSGGQNSGRYKVTCGLTTNTGLVRESECIVVVRER